MKDNIKVLVVIPAFNEGKTIRDVLMRLKKVIEKIVYELNVEMRPLVIDDGSTDDTPEVVRSCGVTLIKHEKNMGPGAAVRTGLIYAIKNGFDVVVQMDADGQHLPEEIPKLLIPILRGKADVVIGSRFLGTTCYNMPLLRKLGIKFYSIIAFLVTGRMILDITSGFRAYGIKAVKFIAHAYPIDFPAIKSTLMLVRRGFRVIEIPTKMMERKRGRSYIGGLNLIRYHIRALKSLIELMVWDRHNSALSNM